MRIKPEVLKFFGNLSPGEIYCLQEEEKLRIKNQSSKVGLCVIAFFVTQTIIGIVSGLIPSFRYFASNDSSLNMVFTLVCYTVSLFVPFLVLYVTMSDKERKDAYCFDKPLSNKTALCAIGAGMLFCMVANNLTDLLMSILSEAGVETTIGDYQITASFDSFIGQLINIAVLPALLEEFAFRFIVMQPLRRFGDKFAIIMSALVFALVHGNLMQIPFAFIVGASIGYFVITTNSIWVGIGIHFFNNAYSVVLSYLLIVKPSVATHLYALVSAVTLVGGIICVVLFFMFSKREKLKSYNGILSPNERASAYILTAPMIITIIISFIQIMLLTRA